MYQKKVVGLHWIKLYPKDLFNLMKKECIYIVLDFYFSSSFMLHHIPEIIRLSISVFIFGKVNKSLKKE